jgi:hypothetical protein
MGKWMNRASSQKGDLIGLHLELEETNRLLREILAETKKVAPDRPAPAVGPVPTLAGR